MLIEIVGCCHVATELWTGSSRVVMEEMVVVVVEGNHENRNNLLNIDWILIKTSRECSSWDENGDKKVWTLEEIYIFLYSRFTEESCEISTVRPSVRPSVRPVRGWFFSGLAH